MGIGIGGGGGGAYGDVVDPDQIRAGEGEGVAAPDVFVV